MTPTVTPYHNKQKDYWYARVYWPGGGRTAYLPKQATTFRFISFEFYGYGFATSVNSMTVSFRRST